MAGRNSHQTGRSPHRQRPAVTTPVGSHLRLRHWSRMDQRECGRSMGSPRTCSPRPFAARAVAPFGVVHLGIAVADCYKRVVEFLKVRLACVTGEATCCGAFDDLAVAWRVLP